jgi:hypothetical protein
MNDNIVKSAIKSHGYGVWKIVLHNSDEKYNEVLPIEGILNIDNLKYTITNTKGEIVLIVPSGNVCYAINYKEEGILMA